MRKNPNNYELHLQRWTGNNGNKVPLFTKNYYDVKIIKLFK